MKALITAIALTFTCNALAEESKDPCISIASYAKTAAEARDIGVPLIELLTPSDSKLIKSVALDVYKRSYLTPTDISNRWALKCYEATASQ